MEYYEEEHEPRRQRHRKRDESKQRRKQVTSYDDDVIERVNDEKKKYRLQQEERDYLNGRYKREVGEPEKEHTDKKATKKTRASKHNVQTEENTKNKTSKTHAEETKDIVNQRESERTKERSKKSRKQRDEEREMRKTRGRSVERAHHHISDKQEDRSLDKEKQEDSKLLRVKASKLQNENTEEKKERRHKAKSSKQRKKSKERHRSRTRSKSKEGSKRRSKSSDKKEKKSKRKVVIDLEHYEKDSSLEKEDYFTEQNKEKRNHFTESSKDTEHRLIENNNLIRRNSHSTQLAATHTEKKDKRSSETDAVVVKHSKPKEKEKSSKQKRGKKTKKNTKVTTRPYHSDSELEKVNKKSRKERRSSNDSLKKTSPEIDQPINVDALYNLFYRDTDFHNESQVIKDAMKRKMYLPETHVSSATCSPTTNNVDKTTNKSDEQILAESLKPVILDQSNVRSKLIKVLFQRVKDLLTETEELRADRKRLTTQLDALSEEIEVLKTKDTKQNIQAEMVKERLQVLADDMKITEQGTSFREEVQKILHNIQNKYQSHWKEHEEKINRVQTQAEDDIQGLMKSIVTKYVQLNKLREQTDQQMEAKPLGDGLLMVTDKKNAYDSVVDNSQNSQDDRAKRETLDILKSELRHLYSSQAMEEANTHQHNRRSLIYWTQQQQEEEDMGKENEETLRSIQQQYKFSDTQRKPLYVDVTDRNERDLESQKYNNERFTHENLLLKVAQPIAPSSLPGSDDGAIACATLGNRFPRVNRSVEQSNAARKTTLSSNARMFSTYLHEPDGKDSSTPSQSINENTSQETYEHSNVSKPIEHPLSIKIDKKKEYRYKSKDAPAREKEQKFGDLSIKVDKKHENRFNKNTEASVRDKEQIFKDRQTFLDYLAKNEHLSVKEKTANENMLFDSTPHEKLADSSSPPPRPDSREFWRQRLLQPKEIQRDRDRHGSTSSGLKYSQQRVQD